MSEALWLKLELEPLKIPEIFPENNLIVILDNRLKPPALGLEMPLQYCTALAVYHNQSHPFEVEELFKTITLKSPCPPLLSILNPNPSFHLHL
jgi:hypothetical protein